MNEANFVGRIYTGANIKSRAIIDSNTNTNVNNAGPSPYTTISRDKNIVTIHAHNLDPNKNYRLLLYTCSRKDGKKHGVWFHPDNYDSEETYGRIGYGNLAGKNRGNGVQFVPVPKWMPNEGYLQTEWLLNSDDNITFDLCEWFFPMLKPYRWSPYVIEGHYFVEGQILGVAKQDSAGRLFRFCLADDNNIYPCRDTLVVGGKRQKTGGSMSTGIKVKLDDETGCSGYIMKSTLYISVR